MSEISLQAIVEKLEALEITLLKQGSAVKDEELKAAVKSAHSEFIRFGSIFTTNNEKMNKLSEETHALTAKPGNPIQNQVKQIISISRYGSPLVC